MKEQTQTNKIMEAEVQAATFQTGQDVKTAILIVSVLANVTVFTLWLMLQLTSRFDSVMASWLLG
jgi:hypothetical protein